MGRLLKGRGYVMPREVLTARQQADKVLAHADAEADMRRQAAVVAAEEERQKGFQQGLQEGREAAMKEMADLMVRVREDAAQVRLESRDSAIPLAKKMAQLIVGRALELHPSLIADIANQALAAAKPRAGEVVVRVSPSDLPVIERERPRLVSRLTSAVDLRLVADDKVGVGGCIIETPSGVRLDARLSTQLETIEKALGKRAPAAKPRPE
jgi:flagellar biosynthesis/type III secretory pathway protein FliH